MREVREETRGFKTGAVPSLPVLFDLHSRLVEAFTEITANSSDHFKSELQTFYNRRSLQAQEYKRIRTDLKMSAADSEKYSLLAVGDEVEREIDAEVAHDGDKAILRS